MTEPRRAIRSRIDDATAHLDHLLLHAAFALACAVALVALTVPTMRPSLWGAVVVGVVAGVRLLRHPLRFTSLRRVYVEDGKVLVASVLGSARPVDVVALEHDGHAPWPCALRLADGSEISFVAKRDDGTTAFFDLELSDRARYERPRDSRDSLATVERVVRSSRPPQDAQAA